MRAGFEGGDGGVGVEVDFVGVGDGLIVVLMRGSWVDRKREV